MKKENEMNFQVEITLKVLRDELTRVEDALIVSLLQRSQFALNRKVYLAAEFAPLKASFLASFLWRLECVHALVTAVELGYI